MNSMDMYEFYVYMLYICLNICINSMYMLYLCVYICMNCISI